MLVHELDHALQDQSFDLKKLDDLPPSEGDALAARHALAEGDGVALMIEVMLARQHQAAPWSESDGDGDDAGGDVDARRRRLAGEGPARRARGADLPVIARAWASSPRCAGTARGRRSTPRFASRRARPPRSCTPSAIWPEISRWRSPARCRARSRADHLADSTVWGELGFDLFLRSNGVDDARAAIAAAGWSGDRAIIITVGADRDPAHAIGLVRLEWETPADALEAQDAATRALEHASNGMLAERTDTRTRWTAPDGTSAWVERKGSSLVLAIGVPAAVTPAVITEVWTALRPGHASK